LAYLTAGQSLRVTSEGEAGRPLRATSWQIQNNLTHQFRHWIVLSIANDFLSLALQFVCINHFLPVSHAIT
jgi:hypothetical protein